MQNTSNFARPIDGGMVLRNRVVVVELNISGTIVACPFTLSLQNSEASYSVVMPTSLAWSCTEPKKSSCSITVASQKCTPGTHISGFVRHGLWTMAVLQFLPCPWFVFYVLNGPLSPVSPNVVVCLFLQGWKENELRYTADRLHSGPCPFTQSWRFSLPSDHSTLSWLDSKKKENQLIQFNWK